jgi:hypothetical protein
MKNPIEGWIVQKEEVLTTIVRGEPEDLPLEILKANLHNKASCCWSGNAFGEGGVDTISKMNERLDLEEAALREAVKIIAENNERIKKAVEGK